MKLVRDLVKKHAGRPIPIINSDAHVFSALQVMEQLDTEALLVMDAQHIMGVFSENDYARKIILKNRHSKTTPIKKVMSKKILYITLDYSLDECLALMSKENVHHLPVIDSGHLVDFITTKDVIDDLVEDRDFVINQLVQYITGSHVITSQHEYSYNTEYQGIAVVKK